MKATMFLLVLCICFQANAQEYLSVSRGQPSPVDGVVMTEQKAKQVIEQKIKLKEIEKLYEIDKKTWATKEDLLLKTIGSQDKKIQELEKDSRSWWNRNKGWVGITTGVVVGCLLSYGLWQAYRKTD